MAEKSKKITLKGYYENLPLRQAPRNDFIQTVAEKCNVTPQTVRNWCIYGMKPQDYKHVLILSELTGIKAEELW